LIEAADRGSGNGRNGLQAVIVAAVDFIASTQSALQRGRRVKKFFYSPAMFYILAALLILVFFLPDLIGPIPALICGALVIGFAIYIYNLWKTPSPLNSMSPDDEDEKKR
jgi:hypothetical protein